MRNYLTSLAYGNLPQVVEVEDALRQLPLRLILPLAAVMLLPKGDAQAPLPVADAQVEGEDHPSHLFMRQKLRHASRTR